MLVLAVLRVTVTAQSPAPVQPSPCSPVRLDGKEVSRVCWSPGATKPKVRADAISERVLRIAQDPAAAPIKVYSEGGEVALMSGEQLVSMVFDGDAQSAGVTKEQLAQQWATAFGRAIKTYREARSTQNIIRRVLLALLIVGAGLVLLIAIGRGTRRVATVACNRLERRLQSVDARVIELLPNEVTRNLVVRSLKLLRVAASLLVIYLAVQFLLGIFPATANLAEQMLTAVLRQLKAFAGAVWTAGPSLVFIAVVAVFTWYLLKFLRYVFRKIGEGAISIEGFRPSWAGTTQKLVSFCVVILALLIAYPYIPGSESAAFKGVSLFLGVLVSLGSTGLVSNLVSGIMLTYVDAFQVGDLVMIGEESGYVVKKSVLTTQLRTRTNRVITIPNANVLTNRVVNLTAPDSRGVVVTSTVGIGYEVPWRQVEGLLKLAASRTAGVRSSPEPFVLERALDQFNVTYEINAYLEPGVRLYLAEAELNRTILDAFNEAGVQIMTPSYEGDPAQPKVAAVTSSATPPSSATDDLQPEADRAMSQAG